MPVRFQYIEWNDWVVSSEDLHFEIGVCAVENLDDVIASILTIVC